MVSGEMDVIHIGQNANSRYARMLLQTRTYREGARSTGSRIRGPRSPAGSSSHAQNSVKSFTDYFPDYGGFTSRADCFALLPLWLPSPSCSSCAGLFISATTVWICPI